MQRLFRHPFRQPSDTGEWMVEGAMMKLNERFHQSMTPVCSRVPM